MEYVAVLLPSIVVGLLFWFAMKAIFNADKSERQAEARAQAEADARAAQSAERRQADEPPSGQPGPDAK
jgi:type II secretory pathway pseudopilin PulG